MEDEAGSADITPLSGASSLRRITADYNLRVDTITVGVNGDRIGYWCTYGSLLKSVISSDRRQENEGGTTYTPKIILPFHFYSKFCTFTELMVVAETLCHYKANSLSSQWLCSMFNLCTMAIASRAGPAAIIRAFHEPDVCPMCVWPTHIRGLILYRDHCETRDLTVVLKYTKVLAPQTRRIVWPYQHDGKWVPKLGVHMRHLTWLWNHPHYFVYDVDWCHYHYDGFSNLNRLELDCLVECDKIKAKVERLKGSNLRLKSLYSFPGPPSKLVELVIPLIWRRVCLHLFALTSGIGFNDIERLWDEIGNPRGFSAYLANDVLMVSDRIKVEFLPWGEGLNIQYWDIHDVMTQEDLMIGEILGD